MCVCSHSSSVQSAFLSAFPPGQTIVCVDRDQHKQNISRRRAAWLRSLWWWWRTCERRTTNSLWLIKHTLFPSCSSSPLKSNVRLPKKAVKNVTTVLLSIGLIVFKAQLLSFFLLKTSWVGMLVSFSSICASRKPDQHVSEDSWHCLPFHITR